MRLSEYVITPSDIIRWIRVVSPWTVAGALAGASVYIAASKFFSADVSFLLAGLVGMSFPRMSYKLPLYIAVTGLVALMITSPSSSKGEPLELLSERIAVMVFFMLIFGVYRMVIDAALDTSQRDRHLRQYRRHTPRATGPRTHSQPAVTKRGLSKQASSRILLFALRNDQITQRRSQLRMYRSTPRRVVQL